MADSYTHRISIGAVQRQASAQLEDLAKLFEKCIQQMVQEFQAANPDTPITGDTLLTAPMALRLIALIEEAQKPPDLFDSLCLQFIHFLKGWQTHLST